MIKKQSNILNIKLSKFLVAIGLLISINGINAAEGGPCKDYGECDEFKYSLNDMASLQRGASTFLNYCYVVIHFNIQDGVEYLQIFKYQKKYFLIILSLINL